MEEENIKGFNICNHFQPGATIQKILQLNDNLKWFWKPYKIWLCGRERRDITGYTKLNKKTILS